MTASAPVPRVCEILCALFKSGVSISSSRYVKASPTGLQAQMFCGFQLRESNVGFRPLAPWEELPQLQLPSYLWLSVPTDGHSS